MNLFHPSSIRPSGFSKVPDTSLLSRFKHNFDAYIELMFQRMVDHTEPICQLIHVSLSQTLTFDTSGIELYVTEDWALPGIALLLMMAILNPLIQILPSRRKPILLTKISPLVMPPLWFPFWKTSFLCIASVHFTHHIDGDCCEKNIMNAFSVCGSLHLAGGDAQNWQTWAYCRTFNTLHHTGGDAIRTRKVKIDSIFFCMGVMIYFDSI